MKNKIRIFTVLAILLPFALAAQAPGDDFNKLFHGVANVLKANHYSQRAYDDSFAIKVYAQYMNWLDNEQLIFLQPDISLLQQAGMNIDDELNGAPVQFYQKVAAVFRKRIVETEATCNNILDKPFRFTINETWQSSQPGQSSYPASKADQVAKCTRWLKSLALERLAAMPLKEIGNVRAEQIVRKILLQNIRKKFADYKSYSDSLFFYQYLKTIPYSADPHSFYQTEEESQAWKSTMDGKRAAYYGVGMQLSEAGGYLTVKATIPGGSAAASHQVEAGDIIVSIEQENGEKEAVAGHNMNEVLSLIIGQEGTIVKLHLRKPGGALHTVALKRAELSQEPPRANSLIVEKDGKRIGYLRFPMFYNGAFMDIRKEMKKLKHEQVDGVIIDLRNNGGGSFMDVAQMIGDFIPAGPRVQIRDKDGKIDDNRDIDGKTIYDGSLVVMVNGGSASASELFSSAMQDYKRAIIIGAPSFGKGTVQGNQPIVEKIPNFNGGYINTDPLGGALWLTSQKFYRISGRSVQLKGVTPDIVLPDYLDYTRSREKDNANPIPYDEIQPAVYTNWSAGYDLKAVTEKLQQRVIAIPVIKQLRENQDQLRKLSQLPLNLQWNKYMDRQKAIAELLAASEKLQKSDITQAVRLLQADADNNRRSPSQVSGQLLMMKEVETDREVAVAADALLMMTTAKTKE
ncbi:carboxy terminal-processing peptidase [Chitinophaga eiseniae]|uniref:Carboxy terminal-processing peptidase n=1 Tax=Chitinophaga eiseniae TaxID=634771 RepID=A0A847SM05_9BACT|nr:carboxy terminal-processing peptidase [Chitinophaga eiseniae]NLR78406.1 carboxy terminal-processing peptidase [Chitinophaga eiseniae]